MATITSDLYAQLSEAAQAEGYSDQELREVLIKRGHTIESPSPISQPSPATGEQPGILGQAVQQVESVYPFIKPVGEAMGALGKRSAEGLTQMREAAEMAFPPDPNAMIKENVAVTAAKGLEAIGKYTFPKSKEEAYVAIGGEAIAPLIPSAIKESRKLLAEPAARFMRTTAGIQERYGKAAWMNPDILTEAPTLDAAKILYKNVIGKLKGKIEYASEISGELLPSEAELKGIVNSASKKVGIFTDAITGEALPRPPSPHIPSASDLQEVLAARQTVSQMLLTKDGMDPMKRRHLLLAKDGFDQYLEDGLPGFKDVSKKYFDAVARESFSTFFPLNKNMSPNALRGMLMLSRLWSGIVTASPMMILEAVPMSPKMLGLGMRMSNQAFKLPEIYGAQFAARIAAMQGVRAAQEK